MNSSLGIRVLVLQRCNPLGIFFKVIQGPWSTEKIIVIQQLTCVRYNQLLQQNDIKICKMQERLKDVNQTLIYHFENMPIQKYWKSYHQKMKIFR